MVSLVLCLSVRHSKISVEIWRWPILRRLPIITFTIARKKTPSQTERDFVELQLSVIMTRSKPMAGQGSDGEGSGFHERCRLIQCVHRLLPVVFESNISEMIV